MQTVEITGKTVHDATTLAADKLGVRADQLRVTVLEETKGLFGKSTVRLRAEVIVQEVPAAEAPVVSSPAVNIAAQEPNSVLVDEDSEAAATDTVVSKPEEFKPAKGRRKIGASKTVAAPAPSEPVAETNSAPAPLSAPAPSMGKEKRAPKAESGDAQSAEGSIAEGETEVVEVVASQRDGEILVELVRELLDAAQLSVTAELGSIAGRYVNIVLDGKDVAFIVGKHGEVLNALQYLVNIVSGRRIERGVRATLDGNDYRRRREEALTQLAQRIAEQVKKRGEEAVLDALPAFERRIVHKALGEIEGITTYSEGEEPNRRVVIAPVD
jgi:spoIIIJ-associated protein